MIALILAAQLAFGTNVLVVETNLGTAPKRSGFLTLSVPGVRSSDIVFSQQCAQPATNKQADEAEMDTIILRCSAGTDQVFCHWTTPDGGVSGTWKFVVVW